jgi:formylglycine-generating enzyme required for sulfatase activity
MTNLNNSSFIEYNSLTNKVELCCSNQQSKTSSSMISDCSGLVPLFSGNNTANYNEVLNDVGINGGPSAYGVYDMAGQVDEWVDLPNTSKTECTEQYNRALRTASSENFLTDKEIKYRFNLNNGVRLVSSKSNIKIYDKYLNLDLEEDYNTANYSRLGNWNESYEGNLTSVGTNGRASYYGTFDQNGLVWEWTNKLNNDKLYSIKINNISSIPIGKTYIRGGSWYDGPLTLTRDSNTNRFEKDKQDVGYTTFGLRLCSQTGILTDYCSVLVSGKIDIPETNTCNYNSKAYWVSFSDGVASNTITNLTSVGTNGGPSYYGTFDQDGLVWELTLQKNQDSLVPKFKGGSYASTSEEIGSSAYSYYNENLDLSYAGFRLASNDIVSAFDFSCFSLVDDTLNPEIIGSCGSFIGAVENTFLIQNYPCTNDEYVSYLNIVDKNGTGDAKYYNTKMTAFPNGGILLVKENNAGSKYKSRDNMGNKPVIGATLANVARLVNWLHNKAGGQSQPNTEYGVYNLSAGLTISKNKANYLDRSFINNIKDVGENGGPSANNTYDQDGNVSELVNLNKGVPVADDTFKLTNAFYAYGGSFNSLSVGKKIYFNYQTLYNDANIGLRLASSYSDPLRYNYSLSSKKNNFFVGVSDTGNPADSGIIYSDETNTFTYKPGSVNYNYSIMKYAITNKEYVKFLNDVDPQGYDDKKLYLSADYSIDTENNNFNNWYCSVQSNVGNNGGSSFYGVYDTIPAKSAGLLFPLELNGLINNSGLKIAARNAKLNASSSVRYIDLSIDNNYSDVGDINTDAKDGTFRIATISNPLSQSNLVNIGNVDNPGDSSNGYGSVSYAYSISKYPVTIQELTNFFNSVGLTAVNTYRLNKSINASYTYELNTQIVYNNITKKYECTNPNYSAVVSWLTAARYCNWLHNKKIATIAGLQDGAYDLRLTVTPSDYIKRSNADYWIPSVDEWHKAVYYYTEEFDSGYYRYPFQSEEAPKESNIIDSIGNAVFSQTKISTTLIKKDVNRNYANKYYVDDNDDLKPVSSIDLYKAVRFCNWMHNRADGNNNTEDGAYDASSIGTDATINTVFKKPNARYWIPSLDEWYKAAYYDSKNKRYWNYATQNDILPEHSIVPYYWIPDESEWYKAAYFNPLTKTYYQYATQSNTLPSGITNVDIYGNGPIRRIELDDAGKLSYKKTCDSKILPYDLVHYDYNIARYPVTNGQYVKFLNENDPSGINTYNLYSSLMSDKLSIKFNETASNGSKYSVYNYMDDKPAIGIDWYKAARYCNWMHNKNSNFTFANLIPSTEYGVYNILGKNRNEIICNESREVNNTANIGFFTRWIENVFSDNRLAGPTTVGTNGNASYYGTYDQNGNVAELVDGSVSSNNDYIYMTDWIRLMGGSWKDTNLTDYWKIYSRTDYVNDVGFRLSSINNPLNFSSFVRVGDLGNKKDPVTDLGSVSYDYRIMEKEFTNDEYVAFLNNVDPSGLASNPNYFSNLSISGIYKVEMADGYRGGILLDNSASLGYKYSTKENMGDKPVNFVNWFDAARVCNWLHNGANSSASSISGSYNLTSTDATRYIKLNDASYWLSTKNEWYKAAFYDPTKNKNTGGYWKYATQNDSTIFPVVADSYGVAVPEYDFYMNVDAKYWIPTEEEWYKAAYHDPNKQSGILEFWNYATQSDRLPRPILTREITSSGEGPYDFIGCNYYNPLTINYDKQCGEKISTATSNITNFSCFAYVGDVGNISDSNGFGSVGKPYYIQKYPLTNYEYVQFLNDVDPQGINTGIFLNALTASAYQDLKSPIRYELNFGYLVAPDMKDKPAVGITWYIAARISNWLHNKSININNISTGTGAYTLNGATAGIIPANTNAVVRIPTADEWYKAAYYKRPSGVSDNYMRNVANMGDVGYWDYPTQSDSHPENFFFSHKSFIHLCHASN